MKSAEVRQKFLDYFRERGHTIVPSSSLVPAGDPTLLFVNAGMVPFKDVFLGLEQRPYTRAATVQKCLRVSGKHNDLEEVGPSPRHHTFFEMLGNFSFGDYFKEDTIQFAWEFLTKELGLPADRLHPTIHPEDDEAGEIWSRVKGMRAADVTRTEDNFWAMGDTGPCGPNSEIIYDRTGRCVRDVSACDPLCECGRWRELWSLVFMQYDRAPDGTLTPLGKVGVDTGMGFERITATLQGVASNYETDLFVPLIDRLRALTGDAAAIAPERLPNYRAVADHARAVTFLLADGVMPSNEGRGYVLRRILRRASYQGRLLGLEEPFLSKICDVVIDVMGSAYPEIRDASPRILSMVADEEERFLATLEAGLTRLERVIDDAGAQTVLSGEEAFRLYDTYGFPIDLTRKVLEARGWRVDEPAFDAALEAQRERGRSARGAEKERDERFLEYTRDLAPTRFVGYDAMAEDAQLLLLFSDGLAGQLPAGYEIDVVLDVTPFYAEGGGQVGDRGRIVWQDGEAEIDTVWRVGAVFVHSGRITRGFLQQGEFVRAQVDESARRATMRNHTATHLLHRALRVVLGPQAKQAGSLVAPDRLRFDFLHAKPLAGEELREVERIVREQVLLDRPVRTDLLPLQQALDLGADAMFDEKYGQEARVVSVGDSDVFSRELCGGTHCRATGEIGTFVIVDQRSVGAGVRRVDALTGAGAFAWLDTRARLIEQLSREYNVSPEQLPERLRAMQDRAHELPKSPAAGLPDPADVLARAESFPGKDDGTLFVIDWLDNVDATALRDLGDELRRRATSAAIVLGSDFEGKANVAVMLTDDLVKRGLHAGKLAKEIGKAMGAGGGGRADVATAGGDPARRDAGLAKARELLAR